VILAVGVLVGYMSLLDETCKGGKALTGETRAALKTPWFGRSLRERGRS
jgi:hypothetical protein